MGSLRPVCSMASPLLLVAVLLLASKVTAGPTIIEWLAGIRYVPPPGLEDKLDPPCQDCTGRNLFGLLAPGTPPCCQADTCPKCGVERARRIVGGTETSAGKYPWIAAFNRVSAGGVVGYCSATLVSADWAITAAHCVTDPADTKDSMTLILGEHTITTFNDEFDTNRKEVALAMDPIVHPNYNQAATGFDYDIALLKLAESVDLGVHTPACLPATTDDFTGGTTMASVYGWGRTDPCSDTLLVATLRETEVTITTNDDCNAISTTYDDCNGQSTPASYTGDITPRMLCGLAPGKDACQNDSGGPLTVEASGQHTLAGVVSWGISCAAPGIPGVYANVANLRTWVDETITANGGIGTLCDA